MAILIAIAAYELVVILINKIVGPISESGIILGTDGLVLIFGFFFNVLIGFELFETIDMYLTDGTFMVRFY